MDLLLLTAGAVVLIGITLWIVWPARGTDSDGLAVEGAAVTAPPMADAARPGLVPQGDRFADQYTSATADLSAGGVATAVEGALATLDATMPAKQEAALAPVRPVVSALAAPAEAELRSLSPRRRMGAGAGAMLAICGGLSGAWLYARWQRERNKPINRLRRNAREMASRLGERIPDVDELPHGAAPVSGAATALLVTALLASRARHRDPDDPAHEVRERAEEIIRAGVQGVTEHRTAQAPKPAVMGIGLGSMAMVAGGAFVVWRFLHRGHPDRSTWYSGE